jgi:hypothetical protein
MTIFRNLLLLTLINGLAFALGGISWASDASLPAINPKLDSLHRCTFLAKFMVCATTEGQILVQNAKDAQKSSLRKVPLNIDGVSVKVDDFQCNQVTSPYCLVSTRAHTASDGKGNGLFKLELEDGSAVLISAGRYRFGPIVDQSISVFDSLTPQPKFFKFDDGNDKLVEAWTSPKFGLLEGTIPLYVEDARTHRIVRFAIDPIEKKAELFVSRDSPVGLPYLGMRSLLFGMWSKVPENSKYLWGAGYDFSSGGDAANTLTLLNLRIVSSILRGTHAQTTAIPINAPEEIVQSNPPQVDKLGDVYLVTGTKIGSAVKLVCRSRDGSLALKTIIPPSLEARITLRASPLVEGVDIQREFPGKQISFQHITVSGAALGWSRPCETTRFAKGEDISARTHGPITQSSPNDTFILRLDAVSPDAPPAPALVITKSINNAPTGIIMDLYGAVGGTPQAPNEVIPPFETDLSQHWAAQAILPGDGDLGRQFANSGATPNRSKTVSALNDLSQKLVAMVPSLSGNITLRTGSAGASTAVEAVLNRPDLYSSAIVFSGAYDWVDLIIDPDLNRFHSAVDQRSLESAILAAPEYCSGSKFLIFHAEDDERASFRQAVAFANRLKAKRCLVGTAFFSRGRHSLSPSLMHDEEAAIFLQTIKERGSRPLLKDLNLARSLAAQAP